MAKSYADLWKQAADLEKEGKDVANFNESVSKLPYQLKDEFRKAGDPKLDEAINKAQSDTFGAAIKGLNMYQGISNPFARRDLAEMYQGGIEQGWKNLTDERTRRQGVYTDYIAKWTGLFGAEAAKKQDLFNNKVATWDREKTLADTEESTRRWNIENARAGAKANSTLSETELVKKISQLKTQGATWEEINGYVVDQYGVDTTTGSFADNQLRKAFGEAPIEKTLSYAEQTAKLKLEAAKKSGDYGETGSGTEDDPFNSSSSAKAGDYYWSGTTKKKKKVGMFGWDWTSADEASN